MKHPFSILKEDYENSGKDYCSPKNCPATIALKRQFNINASIYATKVVNYLGEPKKSPYALFELPIIGCIGTGWNRINFDNLIEGREFHTEIEFSPEIEFYGASVTNTTTGERSEGDNKNGGGEEWSVPARQNQLVG